jgi:hypothetical protein
MTIKELKEKLEQFDDNLIVMVPNKDYYLEDSSFPDVVAKHVCQGVNEADGVVFIEGAWEEDE